MFGIFAIATYCSFLEWYCHLHTLKGPHYCLLEYFEFRGLPNMEINVREISWDLADKPWVQRQGQKAHMLTRAQPLSGMNWGLLHVVCPCLFLYVLNLFCLWVTFTCKDQLTLSVSWIWSFVLFESPVCWHRAQVSMCYDCGCVQALTIRCPSKCPLHIKAKQMGHKACFNDMNLRGQTWFQIC